MKQTKTKLLCLLIAALMLLSLAACGKETATEPNLIKLGDRELLYKGACIMEDSNGNDAVVLTLDFTNNGKENASYLWSVDETVMQNGVELEVASIITNYDTFETVVDNQFKEVAPGATLEMKTAFVLSDTTSEIKATFEELLALPGVGRKSANLIMGDVFGKPAIVTDTHCIRLCNKIGLVDAEGGNGPVEDRSSGRRQRPVPPLCNAWSGSVQCAQTRMRKMLFEGYLPLCPGNRRAERRALKFRR